MLARGEEYRGLKAAHATFLGQDQAAGLAGPDAEPELMGGNRLYLRVRGVWSVSFNTCAFEGLKADVTILDQDQVAGLAGSNAEPELIGGNRLSLRMRGLPHV